MKLLEYEKGDWKVQCQNCGKWIETTEYRAAEGVAGGANRYYCRACASVILANEYVFQDTKEMSDIFLSISDGTKCPDMQALASMACTVFIQRCR